MPATMRSFRLLFKLLRTEMLHFRMSRSKYEEMDLPIYREIVKELMDGGKHAMGALKIFFEHTDLYVFPSLDSLINWINPATSVITFYK